MPISYSLSSSFILPNPNLHPIQFQTKNNNQFPNLKIRSTSIRTNNTIQFLKPYLTSQQKPILYGWLCSAISVYSLSNLLSKFSAVTTATTTVDVRQGLALGGLVLVRLIATYAQHALLWEASLNAVYEVRVHVFDRVMQRELAFFEANDAISSGDIAYRITAEASDLAATLYALLNTIVPSSLQFSAMIMHMLAISPELSLISAMVIPCMVLVVTFLGQELRKTSKKSHISIAALSAYLNEMLPAYLFVKANNAESLESVRFKRLALMDFSAMLNKKRMKAVIPQVIQAIYFGVLSILCAGSIVISRGSFDRCSLVSFVTSLLFLIEPIQDVGKAYNEWREGEPAIERLFAMTRFKNKVVEKPDAVDLDHVTGDLKFCDVSFKYNDGQPHILKGLNLHVRPGEIVAIVGPSGGGKTTLAKLLLRLYDPISGSVLIDNQDIQNIRLQSLRRHVGVVSQDIVRLLKTLVSTEKKEETQLNKVVQDSCATAEGLESGDVEAQGAVDNSIVIDAVEDAMESYKQELVASDLPCSFEPSDNTSSSPHGGEDLGVNLLSTSQSQAGGISYKKLSASAAPFNPSPAIARVSPIAMNMTHPSGPGPVPAIGPWPVNMNVHPGPATVLPAGNPMCSSPHHAYPSPPTTPNMLQPLPFMYPPYTQSQSVQTSSGFHANHFTWQCNLNPVISKFGPGAVWTGCHPVEYPRPVPILEPIPDVILEPQVQFHTVESPSPASVLPDDIDKVGDLNKEVKTSASEMSEDETVRVGSESIKENGNPNFPGTDNAGNDPNQIVGSNISTSSSEMNMDDEKTFSILIRGRRNRKQTLRMPISLLTRPHGSQSFKVIYNRVVRGNDSPRSMNFSSSKHCTATA